MADDLERHEVSERSLLPAPASEPVRATDREELLELLFAHVADAIALVELDGRIVEVNPATCAMLGYEKGEIVGRYPWDFVTSASRDEILALIRRMDLSEAISVQRTYRRRSGELGIMDLRLTRVRCPRRDLVIASCRDLTEQKQLEARLSDLEDRRLVAEELGRLNAELAQQAAHLRTINQTLLDSEQRLRLAIATGGIGLWVWNSTDLDNAGDWSPRMKEIFGLPLHAEVTHEMFLKCVHPEDRARVDSAVMQALAGVNGGEYSAEYRTIHPEDGAERWVTARAQAFFDAEGRAVRFIGTAMDITERKRAEEASARLHGELERRIGERTADLERSAEALRTSEHLARGQLAALTRTLDVLAQESNPERLLEHVLRMIAGRLNGQSVSVYQRDEADDMVLVETFEDDRLHAPSKGLAPARKVMLYTGDHPVWREVIRTGVDVVVGEIDCDPPRIRLGSREGSPWVPWHGDGPYDPTMAVIYRRLAEMGVVATLTVPTMIGGRLAGYIGIRSKDKGLLQPTQMELARALAHQAMLAVQLTRLSRESRDAAIVAERNRMARDLHDTLAQGFTGVIVQLEAAEDAWSNGLAPDARDHVARARALARGSLKEARTSTRALRPRALTRRSLVEAMEEMIKNMTGGTSLAGAFTLVGEPWPIRSAWEEDLLRVGQEVLTNTLRHARARRFDARLVFDPRRLQFELRDDGSGFDPAAQHEGLGLIGIKERVEGMGGTLTIQSAGGQGTSIIVALPAPEPEGDLES